MCSNEIFAAVKLKESPSFHNIIHSICSKAECKVKVSKPIMIVPAAALVKTKKACSHKRKLSLDADCSESDECDNEYKFEEDFGDDSGDSDVDMESDSDEEIWDPIESRS